MKKFSSIEVSVLTLTFIMVILGVILSHVNLDLFLNTYVVEDGIVEWLTVIGLLIGAVVTFRRAQRLYTSRGFLFSIFTIGLGVLMIVAAGEEISGGQRVLGIESSDFFKKNNAQAETNLHNLVSNGVKINRILATGITVCLVIYMIVVPFLYRRFVSFANFLDSKGVILPKAYQTISLLLITGLTFAVPDGKRSELLEFGIVFIFLLIVFYPMNDHIYKKGEITGR